MKYTLTWKDIALDVFHIYILYGFPLFFGVTLCISQVISFFSGTFGEYSAQHYIQGIIEVLPLLCGIYFLLLLAIVATSHRYWKHNIIGEHEILLDEEYFIWKGYRQEVRTRMNLLQKFKVTPKYIIIHFAGVRKAKLKRRWITQGEAAFIEKMNTIKQEMIRSI